MGRINRRRQRGAGLHRQPAAEPVHSGVLVHRRTCRHACPQPAHGTVRVRPDTIRRLPDSEVLGARPDAQPPPVGARVSARTTCSRIS